jgi:hypothetical protein
MEKYLHKLVMPILTVVALDFELLNDQIPSDKVAAILVEVSKFVEIVKSIVATGAMLRSFSRLASPATGISIRILQYYEDTKMDLKHPKYPQGLPKNSITLAKKSTNPSQ